MPHVNDVHDAWESVQCVKVKYGHPALFCKNLGGSVASLSISKAVSFLTSSLSVCSVFGFQNLLTRRKFIIMAPVR